MNCAEIQDRLVVRSELSSGDRQHVDGCEACRRFAADLELIGTLREPPNATPALLREQTLDQCQDQLAGRTATSKMSPWQRCRQICDSPYFVVTVAALGVMIFGWWLAVQIHDIAEGSDSIMSIKLAFVQLGVQNFVAALLFPIVWLMRSNWRQRREVQPS